MISSSQARFSTESSLKGRPAMEILDEAVFFLRSAPLVTISIYFLGTLPFCLGLIYFWFDMTQSADAESRLPGEAFVLTVLYFWMKTCQAVFSRKLLTFLEGEDPEPWTLQRWANTALLQAAFAGSLVILYPLAILATIPFGWVNAFYHSISIVATGSRSTLGSAFGEAVEMARLWPKQNHLILGVLFLAVLVLFFNLAVFFVQLPLLLNSLFGFETVFDENISAWNNSSFYLDVLVFCFLLLNPLNKAIYVLRCFYGRSRLSGTDLKAELRRFRDSRPIPDRAAVGALALLLLVTPCWAQEPSKAAAPVPVQTDPAAVNLDQAIQKTLQKDEFAWRAPRLKAADTHNEFFDRMAHNVLDWLKAALRAPAKMLGKFLKWLLSTDRKHDASKTDFSGVSAIPWRGVLFLLAVILIAVLTYLLVRHVRRRPTLKLDRLAPAPLRTIDLEAETVQADELPEDSWLALAQQLIEQGELRLALRAFYLATLSALARQQLVRLGASKSNRDYLVELTRRLRGQTTIVPSFRENVRLFEASWYGTHSVTSTIIEIMRANQQQVRNHVTT